jgi:hypothetical protein
MLGEESTLKQLRQQVQPGFPTILLEPLKFFEFIGEAPPRIYLVRDGRELQHWDENLPSAAALHTTLAAK